MGLDITLTPKAEQEVDDAREKAWEELYESGRWDAMTDDEKREWRAKNPYSFDSDDDQSHKSRRYPDHLFNRRYLRSSYNGGGFNAAVPDLTGQDHGLYWIFEPMSREWDGDEGWLFEADVWRLTECRKRAEQVADELRGSDRLRVMTVDQGLFAEVGVKDSDALDIYRREVVRQAERSGGLGWGYSNRDGSFFGPDDPVRVLAAIPGKGVLGSPGVHLVYRAEGEGFDSYVQSAEIVVEFIDEAIELIQRDGAVNLSWSG